MKNYSVMSVLYSKIFSFFIVFVILLSYCLFPGMVIFEKIIESLSIIFSIMIFFLYFLNFKYSKFIIILFIYFTSLLVSTMVGDNSSITEVFKIYFRILSLSCFLDYGMKNYTKNTINSFYWSFYILTFINLYTIIRFPNGLYTTELYSSNWFFGYDNTHIFMYLPTLILLFYSKKILRTSGILLFLNIAFSIFYCFSANSVVAFSIFLLYLIFSRFLNRFHFLNIKTYFITYIILFFSFVEFRIQNIFRWFIVSVLHKSLTLSTRTILWDRVLKLIKSRPLLGYGQETTNVISTKYGDPHFTHSHNTFLDVTYKGGIICLILHLILIIIPCKKLFENRDYYIAKVVSVILFTSMIMMIFEARQEKIGLYLILILAYNIKNIIVSFEHNEIGLKV